MRYALSTLLFLSLSGLANEADDNRPQHYAAYKAHTIMPESLRFLVKRDAKSLFAGLRKGLAQNPKGIDDGRIMAETDKISKMIDAQAPFKRVIFQMGYVSGLLAVYTNPSLEAQAPARRGFPFYLNRKLDRCLFVFDGYDDVLGNGGLDARKQWLGRELSSVPQLRRNYRVLLDDRYASVQGDWRHLFGERSAVFGVSSIYFSNLARLTAHLWYYAWASARGDLSRTPFKTVRGE